MFKFTLLKRIEAVWKPVWRLLWRLPRICGKSLILLPVIPALLSFEIRAETFAEDPRAQQFARELQQHGLSYEQVLSDLAAAKRLPAVLRLIQKQPESRATWPDYRARFVNNRHIRDGVKFMTRYRQTLKDAESVFGVPASVVTAIIGVESNYGRLHKTHRALDALATLGFSDYRRAAFFRNELKELFLLASEQQSSVLSYRSSFAGAMGWGQFLPSSYRNYGKDFDEDGKVNLQNNPTDIIGSVANYLAKHDWRADEPILIPALMEAVAENKPLPEFGNSLKPNISLRLAKMRFGLVPAVSDFEGRRIVSLWKFVGQDPPYWMGFDNFYVLSRYNRSSQYIMAVFLLSEALEAAKVKVPS